METQNKVLTIQQRKSYASRCSIAGIILNLFLFSMKLVLGICSHSIAIQADAMNNLTDSLTALVELFGFQMSAVSAGEHHPFGHGRIELIISIIASDLILFMGYRLLVESVASIRNPESLVIQPVLWVILVVSIVIKLVMYYYNQKVGGVIESIALKAIAKDSISDAIATAGVLASSLFTLITSYWIDGYVGAILSIIILYNGLKALAECFGQIMGNAPTEELVQEIKQISLGYEEIMAVRNLYIHDYGEGRKFISMHLEGKEAVDYERLQDIAEQIGYHLRENNGYDTTIQVDRLYKDEGLKETLVKSLSCYMEQNKITAQINNLHFIKNKEWIGVVYEIRIDYRYNSYEEDWRQRLNKRIIEDASFLHPIAKVLINPETSSMRGHRRRINKERKKEA